MHLCFSPVAKRYFSISLPGLMTRMKQSFVQAMLLLAGKQKINLNCRALKKVSFSSFVFLLVLNTLVTGQTLTLTSSKNPECEGSSVTFTATVSPNPGSGTVEFFDGA